MPRDWVKRGHEEFRRRHEHWRRGGGCGGCAVLVAVAISTASVLALSTPTEAPYPHLLLGAPSGVGNRDRNNWLLKKPLFAVSYCDSDGVPNWVSWRLTKREIGHAGRPTEFVTDTTLPEGFNVVEQSYYRGSGFDKGHMCPHSDRNVDATMTKVTFVMSNVVPQSPSNNQKAWRSLEMYCRNLVEQRDKVLYIVCGPEGTGGTGRYGFKTWLKGHKVRVPAKIWKVILVLNAQDDPAGQAVPHLSTEVVKRSRIICVVTPNDMTPTEDWSGYRTSLREVEELTKLSFFKDLGDVHDKLVDQVDDEEIETD